MSSVSEDLQLQQRIADLAGRINRHKTDDETSAQAAYTSTYVPFATDQPYQQPLHLSHGSQYWAPQRGTPYGAPRSRARAGRFQAHRHRTLVLHSASQPPAAPIASPSDSSGGAAQAPGWVTKHDRHMQLINNSVYEQKTQERNQAIEITRKQKVKAREDRELAKVAKLVSGAAAAQAQSASSNQPHQVLANGIRFIIADGGSKLIRASGGLIVWKMTSQYINGSVIGDDNVGKPTPQHAVVGGIKFLRSKHGNLYRSGYVKTMRWVTKALCAMCFPRLTGSSSQAEPKRVAQPCPTFSTTGRSILALTAFFCSDASWRHAAELNENPLTRST